MTRQDSTPSTPPPGRGRPFRRGAAAYWAVALGVIALFYGEFLFSNRVGILDWCKDLYYFAFLYDSLRSFGQMPLSFLAIPETTTWFSTLQNLSYWSNPEVLSFSPLLPLAFALPLVAFMKAFFGLHLLAAAWGVRLLALRRGFDAWQSVLLLLLFLCNPWLVQHLAIGYSPQISLCLVPGIVALLAARDFRPLEWAGASLLAALIFYQGALHLFVWLFLAAGVYVLVDAAIRRRAAFLWRMPYFFLATAVLVAPKAYATTKVYGGWERVPGGGYASLADLWGLLTDDVFPMFQFPETYSHHSVAFYDGSLLVGPAFVALAALLAGGYLLALLRRRRPRPGDAVADGACLVAALVFLVLGWGTVWRELSVWLRLASSEIYPFRFLFVAFHFVAFFVADRVGPWPADRTGRLRLAACVALLVPTLLTFHARNRELMPHLTANPNFYGDFSIAEYMSNRIVALTGQTRLPIKVSPNLIVITPAGVTGQRIALPWMAREEAAHYRFEAARVADDAPGEATVIEVTVPSRQVRITPDDSRRGPLCAAALLAFVLLTAALRRIARARPGLFTPDATQGVDHA